jgi:hypothetical protein
VRRRWRPAFWTIRSAFIAGLGIQTLQPVRGFGLAVCTNVTWYAVFVLGILVLVIPGIIAGTYFSFAIQVATLHGRWPNESFAWSAALVRGNFWRVFFISLLLPSVLYFASDAAVSLVASSTPGGLHWDTWLAIAAAVMPLWLYGIVGTVLFFNLSMLKAAESPE